MKKTLSVIIPTYNMGKYLDACLSSLISDDYTRDRLEVIVVNDGSKDNSSEIAHRYEAEFPSTFIVIDKVNGHYGSCVNKGLEVASGKYVKILDSDDFYEKDNLPAFLSFLDSMDVDMVLSDNKVINETDGKVYFQRFCLATGVIHPINVLTQCTTESIPHQSVTWRTSMLKDMGYRQSEGIPYTDLEWVLRPLSVANSVVYYNDVLYIYRRGREGQTVSPEVHCKNMRIENGVALGNVDFYESIKEKLPTRNMDVLRNVLSNNINRLYYHYLINFHRHFDNKEVVEFDGNLRKRSLEIYSLADEMRVDRKFMIFYYVTEWRKRFSRHTLRFLYFDVMEAISSYTYKFRHGFRTSVNH